MTLRLKLTAFFIAVILLANGVLSFFTIQYVRNVFLDEVQQRVRVDLRSARRMVQQEHRAILRLLEGAAASAFCERFRWSGENLKQLAQTGNVDFALVLDQEGRVMAASLEGPPAQCPPNSLLRQCQEREVPLSGFILLEGDALAQLNPALAEKARFEVRETPNARPDAPKTLEKGLVLAAAVPLKKEGGCLFAGRLLNRESALVDQIKNALYPEAQYQGKDTGTATLFLEDVRVATNVRNSSGQRALGTTLSEEVSNRVIGKGQVWANRAFVVNDWYITAYEPIENPEGKVLGALYVGLLEKPFREPQTLITVFFLLMMLITTLASALVIIVATRYVLRPITSLTAMMRKVAGGDLSARVELAPPGEMGELCSAVNHMAERVMDREEQLKAATARQVSQSEKLAAVGGLAAGIAHEINNPLGAVLTASHLLQEELEGSENQEEIDLIVRETHRVSDIVKGLLDFARERPLDRRPLDMEEVARAVMTLIRNDKNWRHIAMETQVERPLPLAFADRNQMQQVLLNLALNACQAMGEKEGRLDLRLYEENHWLKVDLRDTGCGIPQENLGKIFQPFFSTQPEGKGTGLGLSVSYGIMEQHDGRLEVQSEPGKGTTFTLVLPICDESGQRLHLPPEEEGSPPVPPIDSARKD